MVIQGTKRYVNHAATISIIVLCLGITTLASGIQHTADAWRWLIHTREVLEHVETAHSLINEADALQKSLRLAYDRRDDAEFENRIHAIQREVQVLRRLTSDNPVQQHALADFQRLLDAYIGDLRAGLDQKARYPGKDAERVLRQAINAQVATLSGEEQRLLVLREALVRQDRGMMIVAAAAVSVLSIGLLLFVRAMARRDAAFLAEERAQLDATLRGIGEAVVAVDADGHVRFMNRIAEQLFGYDQAGARGQPLDAVFRFACGGARDFVPSSPLRTVLASRRPVSGMLLTGSGKAQPQVMRDWIFSCYPMVAGQAVYGAVISLLDVTDLKQAQQELRDANLLLEQRIHERTCQLAEANSELRAFAHTVAHDLRAPLRNVQGYAIALLEDEAPKLSETGKIFVQRIQVVSQRMDRLIADLLAYSQLSRAELRLQTVDLERVLELALQDIEGQIAASRAQVEVAPDLPAVVGSEGILVQVFENLIGNAIKFVGSGVRPAIRIEGRVDGELAYVRVVDNGIGIPLGERERVFDVFERLHGEEQYPGTGIGLAIVKKGVERLGGHVNVEAASTGTVFQVCLRIPQADNATRPDQSEADRRQIHQ